MRGPIQLFREHVPKLTPFVAAVLLSACEPMGDFLGPDTGCLMCIQPSPPIAFAVTPDSANILRDDTLTMSAWNCPNGGCILDFHRVLSSWTIAGDAIAVSHVSGSGMLSSASTIQVRASRVGAAIVSATSTDDATLQKSIPITVADSSSIAAIALHTCCSGKDTVVKYGDVIADLLDTDGRRYRAWPTGWSVSDTTIAVFDAHPSRFGADSRAIRIKKAGVVEIRARFLDIEGRVRVTVRP